MTTHTASCRCGQLRATATGEPVRISVCHCLDCQKRSGSAFAAQVRFPADAVTVTGEAVAWTAENGGIFHHCPVCGATIAFAAAIPETIAIPLGAFDNPHAFSPTVSVWEARKHPWLAIAGAVIEHMD